MPAILKKTIVLVLVVVSAALIWQFGFKPRMVRYQSWIGGVTDIYRIRDFTRSSSTGHADDYTLFRHYWRIECMDGQVRKIELPFKRWLEPIQSIIGQEMQDAYELNKAIPAMKVSSEKFPKALTKDKQTQEVDTFFEGLQEKMKERSKKYMKEEVTETVKFECSNGTFLVKLHPEWAPTGVMHFQQLVSEEFFDGAKFFRVVKDFVAQFGIAADPAVMKKWAGKNIMDDPVKTSNKKGTLTFAAGEQPNTRSTQLFINLADNSKSQGLDKRGFAPIGEVIEGIEVVEALYSGYGEQLTRQQSTISSQGNAFLDKNYPELDFIKSASFVE